VSAGGQDKVYDGTTTAQVTFSDNRLAGDQFTDSASATFADKNVGTGKTVTLSGVSISGRDAGNYTVANPTATTTANITPLSLTVSAGGQDKVYDGTTLATVSLSDNRAAGDQLIDSYAGATFADKSVGTGKTVTVSGISIGGPDAGNYTLANTTTTTTANITPLSLSVAASGQNTVYDGTTLATVTLSDNRVAGDQLSDSDTSASFADKNVGSGKTVTVSGISISGPDAGNYTLADPTTTTTANITPLSLTVSAAGQDKVYDGTVVATVTLSDNRLAGDQFTDGDTGAIFADANVGTGKTVTVSGISISGPDAGNYTLANTTATTLANITPRPVTVTADPQSKIQGTIDPPFTYQVTSGSLVSGDSFSGSLERQQGEDVGSYAIQQGTLTAGGNYSLSYVGANLTITQAMPAITLTTSTAVSVPYQPVTFTATVSATTPTGSVPTGTVAFLDGKTTLGTVSLVNGKAVFTTTGLALGQHSMIAVYSGNRNYQAATSTSLAQTVVQATLENDPLNPGQKALFLGDRMGDNALEVEKAGESGYTAEIEPRSGEGWSWEQTFSGPISRIAVYAGTGNDKVSVNNDITVDAWLYAGSGNDILRGGGGNNVLVGGPGEDLLIGGHGRNLLIGGGGYDQLIGGQSDSVLIGGKLDFASNNQALAAVMKEWTRTDATYATRVAHLTGSLGGGLNGAFLLNPSTVHDDGGTDELTAEGGPALYFANLRSRIVGRHSNEVAISI
jgi:hypothetical protein